MVGEGSTSSVFGSSVEAKETSEDRRSGFVNVTEIFLERGWTK